MMGGGGMGGMGTMWVFWLLLVGGVIVLVVVLMKTLSGRSSNAGEIDRGRGHGVGPDRAREILGERYARGELSAEEYRERLRTLEEGGR